MCHPPITLNLSKLDSDTLSKLPNMFILLLLWFSKIELGLLIWFCPNPCNLTPVKSYFWPVFHSKPFSVTTSVRRRRTRTVKVRTALFCPRPVGQTDNGQLFFLQIRTEFGQWAESRQKNPDRQTSDIIFVQNFGRNPDSGQTTDRSIRKIRTIRSIVFEMRSGEKCDKW